LKKRQVVSDLHYLTSRAALALSWLLAVAVAARVQALDFADLTPGGTLTLTSDYIYRGLSESDGHIAGQADLHLGDGRGDFAGVWLSTRDRNLSPYARYDLELYLGHRFDLNGDWGATLSGRSHYYLDPSGEEPSADYQEVSAGLSYLDRWSVMLTAIPNAVRYWYDIRLTRSQAYVAETSAQWLLHAGWFVTGGAGYYYVSGTGPRINSADGYAYGNLGLAYEYRRWRLDVGYFVTQPRARELFPYPIANQHFAATLAWQF
jgi:uncharacterized protein (TIGR02001 family)